MLDFIIVVLPAALGPVKIIFLDNNYKIIDYHSCEAFQKNLVKSKGYYTYVIEVQWIII